MKTARLVVCIALLLLGVWISGAVASAEECTACDQPGFPEAAAFLAGKGYPAEQYTVLLSWQEPAPRGDKRLATGYHVLQNGTDVSFDLYSDNSGNLLNNDTLSDLGIRAKNWDLPPIEQQGEVPVELKKSLPARPVPAASTGIAPGVSVSLPAVDLAALLDEDARGVSTPHKSVQRTGIVRALLETIVLTGGSTGWQTLASGERVWTAALQSPDARAVRVHFAALRLPAGGEVIVYNSDNPAEAYGPYLRAYGDETGLWSASVFSPNVSVECRIPAGADTTDLNVTIDDVVHTYVDFGLLAWAKAADTCNNDVSCFSEWTTLSRAVAGFTFIVTPNQLHCTGALIADTDASNTVPYFLTANHCVSVQGGLSGASSMEFFWLYQTSSCNGTPPALSSVPRTSDGADLLATVSNAVGSDFALVRLRSAPPAGLAYAGWSTSPVTVGTNVAVIHHPQGDYKRISFGTTTVTGSPQEGNKPVQPYSYYTEVHWNDGTTEPASSGSPLFLTSSQLIVGQLWGGYASCEKPEEPDYFGRFDRSFPLIEEWLDPASNPADVDQSGQVDSADLQLIVNAALGISIRYNADVDHSGIVDAVDVQLVINAVLRASGS